MKIYFCDKCNASIPLPDIKENRISIDAGKIYCQACAPKPERSLIRVKIPTFLMAIILSAAVGGLFMETFGDFLMGRDQPASTEEQLQTLAGRVDRLSANLEGLELKANRELDVSGTGRGVLKALSDQVKSLTTEIQGHGKSVEAFRESIREDQKTLKADLSEELARQTAAEDRIPRIEEAQAEAAARLGEALAKLDSLEARMQRTEKSLQALGRGDGVSSRISSGTDTAASEAGGATIAGEDPSQTRRIDDALKLLKHKEGPRRFTAVFELAQLKGPRVEKGLVSALADEKSFVRQAAAERLGEHKVRWTIQPLIQVLKDPDPFVREAVVSSLESIMGRSIGLDAGSEASVRVAKVRELEKWWEENKDG